MSHPFFVQIFPQIQILYAPFLFCGCTPKIPFSLSSSSSGSSSSMMVPEFERPRITEIHIRIDCNGCVHKIKKALNSINGIYDFYLDIPQQKLTIIGWTDPERIIKAIRKVRKIATICSHIEAPDSNCEPTQPPPDGGAQPPEGGAPEPDSGNAPPVEPQNAGGPPPEPPSQEQPNYPPPPPENPVNQNPPPEMNPPPQAASTQPSMPAKETRYEEPVRVIYDHQPDYGYRYGYSNGYGPGYSHSSHEHWPGQRGPSYRHEPPHQPVYHEPPHQHIYHEPPPQTIYHEPPQAPVYRQPPPHPVYHEPLPQPAYVTHSYNRQRPSPSITEYQYLRSPPPPPPPPLPPYATYGRTDHYDVDSYQNGSTSNGNVTSIFSDENPNACTIV